MIVLACSQSSQDQMPEDLEGKKIFLSQKKTELHDLQLLIDDLKNEISILEPEKEKEPIPVNTIVIQKDLFKRYIDIQAKVVAKDVVNVSSETGGILTRINVREGQYVKRGQLVAVTDMQTLEKQIDEIETSLSLANTVHERQKRLWDQNIGSEIKFLETKNNKERLEKSLETLKSQINKKNIYAPISGVVDKEFLKQGELATPGMPIVQILNTNNIKIEADLQESMLGKVNAGDKVDIYFPALDKQLTRTVTQIGRTIDLSNRTFKIEIESSSENGQLKPNLLAEVKINDYTKENALSIPLHIVKEEVSGKKYVFVVHNESGRNIAKKSYIELGESAEGYIIIEKGLNEGDEIVYEGSGSLTDNDPVLNSLITIDTNEQ